MHIVGRLLDTPIGSILLLIKGKKEVMGKECTIYFELIIEIVRLLTKPEEEEEMMGKKRLLVLLGALFLTIPMAFNPLPGVGAENYVSYLALIDFTGPTGSFTSMYAEGVGDFIRQWNDQGGAEGVKLKPIFIDARYDVSRAVSAYQRYRKEPKLMFVYTHISPAARVLYPLTFRDRDSFADRWGWLFSASLWLGIYPFSLLSGRI